MLTHSILTFVSTPLTRIILTFDIVTEVRGGGEGRLPRLYVTSRYFVVFLNTFGKDCSYPNLVINLGNEQSRSTRKYLEKSI